MGGSNAQSQTLQNNPNPEVRQATLATPAEISREYRRLDLQDEIKKRQYDALSNFLNQSSQGIAGAMQTNSPQGMSAQMQAFMPPRAKGQFQFSPLAPLQAYSSRPELVSQGAAQGITNLLGGITTAYRK